MPVAEEVMPEIVVNGHLLTPHQVDTFEAACMTLRMCLTDVRMRDHMGPLIGLKYLQGLGEIEAMMLETE